MSYSAGRKSTTFGQRVMGYTTRRSESMGGGGGGLGYRHRYRWSPPTNVTTRARLLPGSYTDFEGEEAEYFPFVEHYVKRSNKFILCSKQYQIVDGDLTTVGGKCLACRERENGADDISWSMRHAFNVLHLAWYHKVPVFDENGRPKKYSKGKRQGEQITDDIECEGRRCQYCKEGLEKFFGRRVHWSLGSGHMNELAGIIVEIEKSCANCGEGRLEVISYECEKCGHPIIDMASTDLDPKAINSFVSRKRECPKCGHNAVPLRQAECDKCQDPIPTSIFDCELEIKKQGEGTNSTIQVPRWTVAEIPEELKELCKPFVFKKVFQPDPFEVQAKILRIKNPWGNEGTNADDHTQDYDADDPDFSE